MNEIFDQANDLFEYTRDLRRDLHRHPELAFHEFRTAGVVARELGKLGLEVISGVAETGVIALLEGAQPGPVVLVRFDMDALPIQEQTGAEYASGNPGVMHACGHDGHVAIGLTVARMLHDRLDQMRGTVKLIFQPAEEGMGGAERMLAAGILDHPKVNYTLSMHVWNEISVGRVGITAGPLMAGADKFEVRLEGKGGHGAIPQEAVDPVVAAAQVVSALQSIVARNVSPLDTAVVSVCTIHAGEAFNVIPQSATLSGTFRTYRPEVRQRVVDRFTELVKGIAASFGCTAEVTIQRLTPALINDATVAETVRQAVAELPGLQILTGFQSMVSEDMAFILEQAPGCYVMVGSANAAKGLNYGHHHPKFDFDEAALPNAAAVMTAATLAVLNNLPAAANAA